MIEPFRPRVLLITRNLPPLVGGMERLNWHLAEELSKVADVRVIGLEGSMACAPSGIDVREAPLNPLWRFLVRARALARYEARLWRPDVVLAGSGLTAPLARSAAGVCGARTAVYIHGLDVAVKHPVYRMLWLPAIRHMDRVIANSRATAELCRSIGIVAARIGIVHPGVEMPDVPGNDRSLAFRKRHGLGDRPVLLSVGRLSTRKGLREFAAHALPQIVAEQPDTILLIIGDTPTQALHAETQTPESIQAAADAAGVGKHIRFLGVITDYAELGEVYRAADVHVFPVREIPGDPEGFGMVALEAAAHGLPTVAFRVGGVLDAVGEGTSGHLVTAGDYASFAHGVIDRLRPRGSTAMKQAARAFAQDFVWDRFGEKVSQFLFS